MSKWMLTVLFLIGSAFLTHLIPFNSFFRYLDTMIHEFGHALTTLVLSGKVMYIELYADHSGVTYSMLSKPWSKIPVGLSGYMTASVFAWFLFAMYAKGKQRQGLLAITALAVLSLALFVRNGYGIAWLLGFIALNIVVITLAGKSIGNFYYMLIAFLSLEESVYGPFSLVMYSFMSPGRAGDATLLQQATLLPAPIWAVWFLLFSLWCAKQALQAFFGRKKGRSQRKPVSEPTYE